MTRHPVARRVGAAICLTLGLLLVPLAAIGQWATTVLLDTERFVATFEPLVETPAVQDRVIDEVTALVDEQLDISQVTGDLLGQLGTSLELGPRAQIGLELLQEPLAAGVRSLVHDAVDRAVRSDAFAAAWERSLALAHAEVLALLRDEPGRVVVADDDGTILLPLQPLVAEVRDELVDRGVRFAAIIPDTDRTIELARVDNLPVAQVIFQLGTGLGQWLPVLTVIILTAGVSLSTRRPQALAIVGGSLAALLVTIVISVDVFRAQLAALIGADPSGPSGAFFTELTRSGSAVFSMLVAAATVTLLAAWWLAPWSPQRALRGRARDWLPRRDPSHVGSVSTLDETRPTRPGVVVAASLAFVAPSVFGQTVSVATVIAGAALCTLVLVADEYRRRPADHTAASFANGEILAPEAP